MHLDRLDWLNTGERCARKVFYANRMNSASYMCIESSFALRPGALPDVMGIFD